MWIDRKDWLDVRKRLEDLERKHDSLVADVKAERTLEIPTGKEKWVMGFSTYHKLPETRPLDLKSAVQRILDQLGLRFAYVEGSPERIDLTKAVKK